uniref:Rho guanine nucleotide exchange factor n=1 Tax=Globodera rostochiensis TaxID=31243 RepID=A0A914HS03_GLORO
MPITQSRHPFRASLVAVETADEFNLFGLFADPVRVAASSRTNNKLAMIWPKVHHHGEDDLRPSRTRRLSLVEALNNGSIDIAQNGGTRRPSLVRILPIQTSPKLPRRVRSALIVRLDDTLAGLEMIKGSSYFFVDDDIHRPFRHHSPQQRDQHFWQPLRDCSTASSSSVPPGDLLCLLDMPRPSRLPLPPAHLRPGKFPVNQDDVTDSRQQQQPQQQNGCCSPPSSAFSSHKRRSRSQPGTRIRELAVNTATNHHQQHNHHIDHSELNDFIDEDCCTDESGTAATMSTTTTTNSTTKMNSSTSSFASSQIGTAFDYTKGKKSSCGCSQDSGVRSSTHSAGSLTTTASSSEDGGEVNGWGVACCSAASSSPPSGSGILFLAEAVWEHVAMLRDELPFRAGEEVAVLDCPSPQLWYGVCGPRSGWFPASYVRPRNRDLCKLCAGGQLEASHKFDPSDGFPSPEMRMLRRRIVQELISTEREYVRLLHNLVQGFLEQCRRRRELFPEERVQRIFGNLQMILMLHSRLLHELETELDEKEPEQSAVANVFLRNCQQFGIYTDYCNNRTLSCTELVTLEQQPQFLHFFEACRLLRGMPALSLDSVLLTPVQRICRYPLQLLELLKATPAGHPDRLALELAQRTMRQVAAQVNDGKRRVDAIQKIWLWQKSVHGFRGPDLVESNHRMLINGELHCRTLWRAQLQWVKSVHVYLFDQTVVLCRRDVLRRNQLVFKERMALHGTSVQELHDGKEPITGASFKNAFKLSGQAREYVFSCPDPATKGLWLEALRERPRPQPPTPAERRLAMLM